MHESRCRVGIPDERLGSHGSVTQGQACRFAAANQSGADPRRLVRELPHADRSPTPTPSFPDSAGSFGDSRILPIDWSPEICLSPRDLGHSGDCSLCVFQPMEVFQELQVRYLGVDITATFSFFFSLICFLDFFFIQKSCFGHCGMDSRGTEFHGSDFSWRVS